MSCVVCCLLLMTCMMGAELLELCQYYSQELPLPLRTLITAYSPAANSIYLMAGDGNSIVYEWDLGADDIDPEASNNWFSPISTIPDSNWAADGVRNLFSIDEILYAVGLSGAVRCINRFNVTSNEWLPAAAEPPRNLRGGCVAYDGTYFIMFDGIGYIGEDDPQNVYIQFYDIAKDEWTVHIVAAPFTVTFSAVRWRYQYCHHVNGTLYVFGGKTGSGDSVSAYLNWMWRYDVTTRQFINIGTLPDRTAYGSTVYDGHDRIYLVGGWSTTLGYAPLIRLFDVNSETISEDAIQTLQPNSESGVFILNGKIWILGGEPREGVHTDKVEICDLRIFLPTNGPTAPPSDAPTAYSSTLPLSTPIDELVQGSGALNSDETSVLVAIVIVLLACGCFCVAVLYFVSSRKSNRGENDIAADNVQKEHAQRNPAAKVANVSKVAHVSAVAHVYPPPYNADRGALSVVHQHPFIQLQHPSYPQVPPHYGADAHGPHQQWPQVLHPQNDIPQQSALNIVQVADDGNNGDPLTAEGQPDDEKEQSKTRSSDSSVAMHDDHWAVYKVTNMYGVDDAQKLEIFEKDGTNGPDTKGTNH